MYQLLIFLLWAVRNGTVLFVFVLTCFVEMPEDLWKEVRGVIGIVFPCLGTVFSWRSVADPHQKRNFSSVLSGNLYENCKV